MRYDFELVLRAGFKKAEETLNDGCGGMMSLKVDERFIGILWWRGDVRGFLGIVDKIASVDPYIHISIVI